MAVWGAVSCLGHCPGAKLRAEDQIGRVGGSVSMNRPANDPKAALDLGSLMEDQRPRLIVHERHRDIMRFNSAMGARRERRTHRAAQRY